MKVLKFSIIVSLLMFSFFGLQGQEEVSRIWSQIDSIHQNPQTDISKLNAQRWNMSTSVGTSFGYSPYLGSSMNMFAAPHLNYSASERLTFHVGIMAMHSMPMLSALNNEDPYSEGFSNMSVFVAASYQLTNNLVLHGVGVKSIIGPMGFDDKNIDFNDISIGATYNFGSFSVGASFHKSDNSFMRSPFGVYNNPYGSSFAW